MRPTNIIGKLTRLENALNRVQPYQDSADESALAAWSELRDSMNALLPIIDTLIKAGRAVSALYDR